ncbi:sigma-70 family RNA polymerase sigma factor [Spartinivicinus ruber]|uniref:sigma-70 family RNA polymerase sigma factor n=1 Tax=Spartinivicinus ruber TaxID=2683272 RepID=UPI0013D4F9C3|nr:sigma-70 family RNA polymerase sigma factor [Spartinivicinus ruber]
MSGDGYDEQVLWSLSQANDADAKTRLIELYTPFVKQIARSWYNKLNFTGIGLDDCYQQAYVALLELIPRFDPEKNSDFKPYLALRVKGAILNVVKYYSENGHYYCWLRSRNKEAIDSFITNEALKDDKLDSLVDLTLELAVSYWLSAVDYNYIITEFNNSYKMENTIYKELIEVVERLPKSEKFIINHYYFYQLSFVEIAELMALSRVRVSQLHAQGIKKLLFYLCNGDKELLTC